MYCGALYLPVPVPVFWYMMLIIDSTGPHILPTLPPPPPYICLSFYLHT